MSASFKWYHIGRHGKYAGIFYRIADISLGGIRIIIRKFPKNRCFHKYIPVIFCPPYSSAVSSIDVQGDNTVDKELISAPCTPMLTCPNAQ